jgi:DNA polymerase I
MPLNYIYVDSERKLDDAQQDLLTKTFLGLDSETSNTFDPRTGHLRLIQIGDNDKQYIIDFYHLNKNLIAEKLKPILENPQIKKILHNVKFDYKWFLHHLNIRIFPFFDTQIAHVLLEFTDSHKLKDTVKKYLNVSIDKVEQNSDWTQKELSKNQLEYAATDVLHMVQLREILVNKLAETGQLGAMQLELDVIPAFASIELSGIPINEEKLINLIEKNEFERDKAAKPLKEFLESFDNSKNPLKAHSFDIFGNELFLETTDSVNISSNAQVVKRLNEIGIPAISSDAKIIKPMLKAYPQLQLLLDYRKYEKLCTTYGKDLLARLVNGRLYGSFNSVGTITLRASASNPNQQNFPRTKEFRECFAPKPGRKFLQCDFSQIELRILAEFSGDVVMADVYNKDLDIHTMTTSKVFGISYDEIGKIIIDGDKKYKQYDDERTSSKVTNFSVVYGIGAPALSSRLTGLGLSVDEEQAQKLIDGFLTTYKDAAKWLKRQEYSIKKCHTLTGVAGHKMKLNFDPNDRQAYGKAKRDAKNYPIQNASACITKVAMKTVHDVLVRNYPTASIVNCVHDELICESDEGDAQAIKELLETEMVKAGQLYLKKIKTVADAKIVDSWGEK